MIEVVYFLAVWVVILNRLEKKISQDVSENRSFTKNNIWLK